MEIVKQASFGDARPPLFHYRTAEGAGVGLGTARPADLGVERR